MAPSSQSAARGFDSGLTGVPGGVLAFAVLCLLGLLAVVCGVLFEIGRARRDDASGVLVARHQFRWRMASALVWCAALGMLTYATSWGWPRRNLALGLDGRAWLQLLCWAMLLVLVGLVLLAQDLWRVRARSAVQEATFHAGLSALAQQEIERAAQRKAQTQPAPTQDSQDADSSGATLP